MKRITALLIAVAMMLGSVGVAQADGIDIKVKGQWDFAFGWASNMGFKDSNTARTRRIDDFEARHRVRTQINFITSEYLQAVLMFEIGDLDWGRNRQGGSNYNSGARASRSTGGALDADGVNVETKRAYLDWVIPNTEVAVRMGIQGLALPSTPMGSPVFNADVAGILVSSPITDWLSAAAFWIRPFDAYNNGDNMDYSDEVDAFGVLLPVSFDGIKFTPWFIYGFVGANSGIYDYLFDVRNTHDNSVTARNSSTQVYWIGAHLELSLLDPLVFNIEGIYGHLSQADLSGFAGAVEKGWGAATRFGTSGWFIGATLDYKLDFMTPGIFGWYASGDDANSDDSGKLGRMPVLGNDGGSFGPTSFGSAGYYGITQNSNSGTIMGTGTGTWGIGLQLANISFIQDLSHTVRLAYYRGTNDADLIKKDGVVSGLGGLMYSADRFYLTDEDYVWEVNFDHKYKIYENLTAVLELGWLRMHTDEDTWGKRGNGDNKENDNAWKAQIAFRYTF